MKMGNVTELQSKLRSLSSIAYNYIPDLYPDNYLKGRPELKGYSESVLTLAVYKKTNPVEFAEEQATFMMFLGPEVCPKILAVTETGYMMEYLEPYEPNIDTLLYIETFLDSYIWDRSLADAPYTKTINDESWRLELANTINVKVPDWALDKPCLIHGDPTLDNTLFASRPFMRITDPIPPHRLIRPSIIAIDQSKILQSFLGWEYVLRGRTNPQFNWPRFMEDSIMAYQATFWTMVSLKRIALRRPDTNAGRWAAHIGKELEECVL